MVKACPFWTLTQDSTHAHTVDTTQSEPADHLVPHKEQIPISDENILSFKRMQNHMEFSDLQIWLEGFQQTEKTVCTATSSFLKFPSSLQDPAVF